MLISISDRDVQRFKVLADVHEHRLSQNVCIRKAIELHKPRYRCDCLGELIKVDGSHHDWLEGCSLMIPTGLHRRCEWSINQSPL